MIFNSIIFASFLPIVFILYWFVLNKNLRAQNLLIVVASYFFYGWWDWRFLSLLFFSSSVDFIVGLLLEKTERKKIRRYYLLISLMTNLGLLGFFKYYNFFIDSLIKAGASLGINFNESTLNIILPVGISFYTFQTLSYSIDVYRHHLKANRDIVSFFAFVSFFPQLVAGPIERASNLLPQFQNKRTFNLENAKDGLRQILWGLMKKVVVADTLAIHTEMIFDATTFTDIPGVSLIIGVIIFTFQIYCDFSGYSDIGIGTARLFGFSLMRNFAFPFFSRNINEFWQRWHISLSTWFRDYVYIPLGGSRVSKIKQIRNILATYMLSGLWHGANWTFLVWGFLHAIYYIPVLFTKSKGKYNKIVAYDKKLPSSKEFFQILLTFSMFVFSLIFFRSENISRAFDMIYYIYKNMDLHPDVILVWLQSKSIVFIFCLLLIEWIQRRKQHPYEFAELPGYARWSIYIASLAVFIYLGQLTSDQQFIYFQF